MGTGNFRPGQPPGQPPGQTPPAESWRSSAALLLSLLLLSLCVCLGLGAALIGRPAGPVERYSPSAPGTAALYRITGPGDGAGAARGFVSINVLPAGTDALAYAQIMGHGSRAIEVRLNYSALSQGGEPGGGSPPSWQVEYYGQKGGELLLIARQQPGQTSVFNPPLQLWSSGFFSQAISGQTVVDGVPLAYQRTILGQEALRLPNGADSQALKISLEWNGPDGPAGSSLSWYVPGLGLARYEEFDAAGGLLRRFDLLNSTRLSGPAPALPAGELLADRSASPAFFRADAQRSGAHPEAAIPPSGLQVVYRRPLGRPFSASPVAANGLLYVADQAGIVSALDAASGELVWQFGCGGAVVAAPAVAGGVVYVGAADKKLYALEARRGLFLWAQSSGDNFAASPLVENGLVYIGSEDGYLYAFDALSGARRWRFGAGGRITSSAALAGGLLFFGADNQALFALDAASGALRWRYPLDAALQNAPAVSAGGVVFAASSGGLVAALRSGTGAESGAEAWTVTSRFGSYASPALGSGLLFTADQNGELSAYRQADGQQVWRWQAPYGQYFASSPLLLGQTLLAVTNSGVLHLFDAQSGASLQELALDAEVSASPAWQSGSLYLTTQTGEVLRLAPAAQP